MEFVNRTKELKDLEDYYQLSLNKLFSVVIYGQRRIGKTALVKKFIKNKKHFYFFVDDSKNSKLLLDEFVNNLKEKNIITKFEKIDTWKSFFEIIFSRLNDYIIIFDEFQNFNSIDKSIYSTIQYFLDESEDNSGMFIFLGSVIGLMKTIFEDQKEPLFGRIKVNYNLKELNFNHAIRLLKKLGYDDFQFFIEFYSLFGGYPRYYVLLEDFNLKNKSIIDIIEKLVLEENSILKNEVLNTLKLNFGKGKQNYYSILEAIGSGNTKITNIANYINLPVTSTTFFMDELSKYYEFIKREIPIIEINNKKSKNGIYKVKNNFFNFYFKFIFKNLSLLEFGNKKKLIEIIKNNYIHLVSKTFEDITRNFLKEINDNYIYGTWWNRVGEEIDICGINDDTKQILFGEVKWQDNVDAKKVLNELKQKTKYVNWNNDEREDMFVLFAKSFKLTLKQKNEFEKENNCRCYTLKDLEKVFK